MDSECSRKSVYRTLTNNKFSLGASALTGDIQFVFNSLEGLQDTVMRLVAPALSSANYALCKGWGYKALDRITYRIGNCPEQYQSGEQNLYQNMIDMPDQFSKEALYGFGGNPIIGGAGQTGDQLEAYVPLNFPWSRASSCGKPRPLPTDLLLSPVIIRINLKPAAQVVSVAPAAPAFSGSWSKMSLRFRQVVMEMKDNLLKNRTPASAVYSYPLKYYAQFDQVQALQGNGAKLTYNLTGFRNGRVKKILFFVTRDSLASDAQDNATYAMSDVEVRFNGDVMYQTEGAENGCWSLISARSPAVVSDSQLVWNGVNWSQTVRNNNYVVVDFAQVLDLQEEATTAIGGQKIDNAILNLQFACVDAQTDISHTYRLHSVYLYECTALFSMGSADLIW